MLPFWSKILSVLLIVVPILAAQNAKAPEGQEPQNDNQQEAGEGVEATLQVLGLSETDDHSEFKDTVKVVLEDFELSILESESLQLNASAADQLANSTLKNETEGGSQRPKLSCLPSYHVGEGEEAAVTLLNATELQARLTEESNPGVTNRTFPANCSLTFFYASWCEFRKALLLLHSEFI
jgi:hypothetical protein